MKKINHSQIDKSFIEKYLNESIDVAESQLDYSDEIINITKEIINNLNDNSTIFVCGNGGSASDSQHFAAELIGRFEKNRHPLPAIALTTDTSVLTAIANDFGYKYIFSKQLEALAKKNDIFIALTTSGESENIVHALDVAKNLGMKTVCFTGNNIDKIKNNSDFLISISSHRAGIIQQAHITILQIIAGLLENCVE